MPSPKTWPGSKLRGRPQFFSPTGPEAGFLGGEAVSTQALAERVMAAAVPVRDRALTPGPPEVLFSGPLLTDGCGDQSWDVAPDGRFPMRRIPAGGNATVRVALNWIAQVRARLEGAP